MKNIHLYNGVKIQKSLYLESFFFLRLGSCLSTIKINYKCMYSSLTFSQFNYNRR